MAADLAQRAKSPCAAAVRIIFADMRSADRRSRCWPEERAANKTAGGSKACCRQSSLFGMFSSLLFSCLSHRGDFHGGDGFLQRAAQLKERRGRDGFHAAFVRCGGRESELEVLRKIQGTVQPCFVVRVFQDQAIELNGAVMNGELTFAGSPAGSARVKSAGVHAGADIPALQFEVLEMQFATGGKLREKGVAAGAGGCQMELS